MTVDKSSFKEHVPLIPALVYFNNSEFNVQEESLLQSLSPEEADKYISEKYQAKLIKANNCELENGISSEIASRSESRQDSYGLSWQNVKVAPGGSQINLLSSTSYIGGMYNLDSENQLFDENFGESSRDSMILGNSKTWDPVISLKCFEKIYDKFKVDIRQPISFTCKEYGVGGFSEVLAMGGTPHEDDSRTLDSYDLKKPENGSPSEKLYGIKLGELKPKPSFAGHPASPANNKTTTDTLNSIASPKPKPKVGFQPTPPNSGENPAGEFSEDVRNRLRWLTKYATTKQFKNSFLSYIYCPTVYGEIKLPSLLFHCSIPVKERVIIIGGIQQVPNNRICDISKIKVKGPEYPFPLKNDILNNPTFVNNDKVYVVDGETSVISSPELFGDIPPPLCCASVTMLNARYIFYYGGFTVSTTLVDCVDDIFYLERQFSVNSKAWILDTITFKFKQIKLAADEGATLQVSIKLERFGHTTVTSELETETANLMMMSNVNYFDMKGNGNRFEGSSIPERSQVTLYVFGGYNYNQKTKKYACSNYNWKIDLGFSSDPANNILNFDDTGYYSCLVSINEGPIPRGFHAAILLEEPSAPAVNYYSSNSSTGLVNEDTINRTTETVMIVHGGTNLSNIFGDMWKYNFHTKKWEKLKVRTNKFNSDSRPTGNLIECEFHRANHHIIMLDTYLVFVGGFSEPYIRDDLLQARKKYNSSNLHGYKENWLLDVQTIASQLENYSNGEYFRIIMLNMNTNTFVYSKTCHKVQFYINYKEIFRSISVPIAIMKQLRMAIEQKNADIVQKILLKHEHIFDESSIKKLVFAMKSGDRFTNKMNILGGYTCFTNNRMTIIGGSFLPAQDFVDSLSSKEELRLTPNSSLREMIKDGCPSSALLNLQIPVFATPSLHSYSVNTKSELST